MDFQNISLSLKKSPDILSAIIISRDILCLFLEDDFVSKGDSYVECMILQIQIEIIDGKKENIIIPKMKQIREQQEEEMKRKFFRKSVHVCTLNSLNKFYSDRNNDGF